MTIRRFSVNKLGSSFFRKKKKKKRQKIATSIVARALSVREIGTTPSRALKPDYATTGADRYRATCILRAISRITMRRFPVMWPRPAITEDDSK